MSVFHQNLVMNDMGRFADGIRENYSVQNVEVLQEEQSNSIVHLGYIVQKKNRRFKAFMPYTVWEDGRYQLPKPMEWTLVEINAEGQEIVVFSDKYLTLGRFMDAIYEAVE